MLQFLKKVTPKEFGVIEEIIKKYNAETSVTCASRGNLIFPGQGIKPAMEIKLATDDPKFSPDDAQSYGEWIVSLSEILSNELNCITFIRASERFYVVPKDAGEEAKDNTWKEFALQAQNGGFEIGLTTYNCLRYSTEYGQTIIVITTTKLGKKWLFRFQEQEVTRASNFLEGFSQARDSNTEGIKYLFLMKPI